MGGFWWIEKPIATFGVEKLLDIAVFRYQLKLVGCSNEVSSWSERRTLAGPLKAKNLRRAFIILEVIIDSRTSICTALEYIQVKITAHLLLSAEPPGVFLVITSHGLKTSIPTLLNGGHGAIRSASRSAILWVAGKPRNFLHVTHLLIIVDTSLLLPVMQ